MATERGYVLVATTVFATVLLAFLGLASDVGYLQWQKMRAQTAADAAAAGAGLQLLEGGGNANIISEGQTDAGLNGFTNGAASTTVTVNHPPPSWFPGRQQERRRSDRAAHPPDLLHVGDRQSQRYH